MNLKTVILWPCWFLYTVESLGVQSVVWQSWNSEGTILSINSTFVSPGEVNMLESVLSLFKLWNVRTEHLSQTYSGIHIVTNKQRNWTEVFFFLSVLQFVLKINILLWEMSLLNSNTNDVPSDYCHCCKGLRWC